MGKGCEFEGMLICNVLTVTEDPGVSEHLRDGKRKGGHIWMYGATLREGKGGR